MYTANHEWGGVVGPNQTYSLTLTVSDGVNIGQKVIEIVVNNRLPCQIFSDELTVPTRRSSCLTYLPMMMDRTFL